MTDEQSAGIWPLPKFYFSVKIGGIDSDLHFQEVTGLDAETQIIEYRAGNSPAFSPIKMPGIAKTGNVTLKRGVLVNDNNFWSWYSATKLNTIKRETITISLMDEAGTPSMTWTLSNAWPIKVTSSDLKADGNEIAIEAIELAYETMTISNAANA